MSMIVKKGDDRWRLEINVWEHCVYSGDKDRLLDPIGYVANRYMILYMAYMPERVPVHIRMIYINNSRLRIL